MKQEFPAGSKVELKHKDTAFYDPQTGFDISGPQTVKLGDQIGKLTKQALVSGALLVIGDAPAKPKAKPESDAAEAPAKPKGKAKGKPDAKTDEGQTAEE